MNDFSPKEPPVRTLFVIPMFVTIEATDQDAAESITSDLCIHNTIEFNNPHRAFAMRMCEASPTTEIEWDGDVDTLPHTLEGLTCDSGSDRSATALVHRLLTLEGATTEERLTAILQVATGWLQQRMTLHPHLSTRPAQAEDYTLSAASLLLHAYARCEAMGSSALLWNDLRTALAQAKAERPGDYDQLLAIYERAHKPRDNKDLAG